MTVVDELKLRSLLRRSHQHERSIAAQWQFFEYCAQALEDSSEESATARADAIDQLRAMREHIRVSIEVHRRVAVELSELVRRYSADWPAPRS